MASAISHIILTHQVYPQLLAQFQRPGLFIGSIFPDIRYLNVIDRDQTHLRNVTLDDVLAGSSDFAAGVSYHSLTDKVREKFVVDQGIYKLCPSSPYGTAAVKVLEDELFYGILSDYQWQEIIGFFENVLDEERQYKIADAAIRRWHQIMQSYFAKPPTPATRARYLHDLNFPQSGIKEISDLVELLKSRPKVVDIMENCYKNFAELVQKHEE